jgi:protein-tyrosine-phosphatase/DNA-binding transcriptional ArsR family regulator
MNLIQYGLEVKMMSMIFHLTNPPDVMKLFGHTIRWQLLQVLAVSDLCVQELVGLLKQPQNLVSYHLKILRQSGLLRERRSLADSRKLYYSMNLDRARALYFSAGNSLHPALVEIPAPMEDALPQEVPPRVLFLCTQNSARSQMAEGILRKRSGDMVEAFSAGTEPTSVHPLAIRALQEMNIDIIHQRSKSVQEFLGQNFDYIITVCDRAREVCPVFPGDPVQIHWSFPDPVEMGGSESERLAAFREVALQLNTRIGYLLLAIGRKLIEKK